MATNKEANTHRCQRLLAKAFRAACKNDPNNLIYY